MNELIKVEERNGIETINARELHVFLESKQEFANWIKTRIEKYEFTENIDFTRFDNFIKGASSGAGNRTIKDYYISLDMAKELSMVENNEKGKQARQYFIAIEKRAKELVAKPMNQFDMMRMQIQMLEDQEKRLKIVEAKIITRDENIFSVSGYASLQNRKITTVEASAIGKKATKLSKEMEYPVSSTYDPRFGKVNIYHTDILTKVFADYYKE